MSQKNTPAATDSSVTKNSVVAKDSGVTTDSGVKRKRGANTESGEENSPVKPTNKRRARVQSDSE